VKIGLPDTLRYQRYGAFWEHFLPLLGAEVVKPQASLAESLAQGQHLLADAPASIQLFVGRVLALVGRCDAMIVPKLSSGEPDGDPWNADLALVLRHRLTLPPLWAVPLASDEQVIGAASRWGQEICQNNHLVRRSLERSEHLLRPAHLPEPLWSRASQHTIALIAEPTLLEQPFLWPDLRDGLAAAQLHPLSALDLTREQVLARGAQAWPDLSLDIEREIAGALAVLAAKPTVRGLVFLLQPRSGLNGFFKRLAKRQRLPQISLELGSPALAGALAAFASTLTAAPVVLAPPKPRAKRKPSNTPSNTPSE
jgi:hypothetical protein